ncbi:hypothetical protein CIL05_06970 [Virgibacillus profundi]|uniref:Uncharacterized protein n=1 Tax=Virgibacillus profundi TaxID=2024555 RepID=A0A2A2IDX0_9BACI|nr:hypothetical protein [Virgibacillus profundi]PAV30201.1 hypothetical protein CIL05_06970 [Virgibacillus profundi]PXY54373.1 hypothetical protein CIT14_07055 [Virgibacillus profundi]
MKTILITLLLSSQLIGGFQSINTNQTNVGNKQPYQYEITNITNNTIHGIPINKASHDNKSIFLYDHEISFNVSVGDKIQIVWGNEEDIFKSITKVKYSITKGDH